ncbi:LLM class flavin-dependent oxidoreductase [Streptomyces sp. NPDC047097]|uniref:LLM class flavin-dependent oxidoreductase n=1 Tax=Streptomyces sp. NPDC047097 TaxID=3155260 RepID=UPI0033EAB39A
MSLTPVSPLHLAVALDGTGWHPASWREPGARPRELFTAAYWADLVTEAEAGLLDFVTIEDGLAPQSAHPLEPDERTDQVRGRLDAVLIASRVAPLTRHIGLVPTVVATHTEPFHISKAIATLDYVSGGRAGVRVRYSARPDDAAHFGRRTIPRIESFESPEAQGLIDELAEEAADYVEAVRRLWDSWEDGAEIRDAVTGRFIDRDKLHYIDFEGRHFSVRGPSITPRPPQGQPVVSALGHQTQPYRLIAHQADIGYITPYDAADTHRIVGEIRAEQQAAGRAGEPLHLFADLVVFLDDSRTEVEDRRARLDALAGEPYTSDARIFSGTEGELAELIEELGEAGVSGVRLRPGVLAHDLPRISRRLAPELRRRGRFREAYEAGTLRGLLGLDRPANRYAATATEAAGDATATTAAASAGDAEAAQAPAAATPAA